MKILTLIIVTLLLSIAGYGQNYRYDKVTGINIVKRNNALGHEVILENTIQDITILFDSKMMRIAVTVEDSTYYRPIKKIDTRFNNRALYFDTGDGVFFVLTVKYVLITRTDSHTYYTIPIKTWVQY